MKLPSIRSRSPDDALRDELRAIHEQLVETNRLLGELVAAHAAQHVDPAEGRVPAKAPTSGRSRSKATRRKPAARSAMRRQHGGHAGRTRNRRVPLHEEIAAVLREAGEPLTAKVIAEQVVARGIYDPPRSGHPVRGGQISARVNHRHYRALFGRQDGKITLAE